MEKQKQINKEEQINLTVQIAQELINLLKDPKVQVKYGCLNAILQYTKSQQSQNLFDGSNIFSQINKVLNNQKLTKICLSTLIHFSSNQKFQKQFIRFVEPLIFDLKDWKDDLRQQLSLLCLLNISKYECIVQQIINTGQKKGFMAEVLYGFMEIKQVRRWVITNIFVNISSFQVGRKYICEQKIYLRFISFINSQKQAVRMGVLKLLRNISFQWQDESFALQFLKNEYNIINKLGEHLIYMIQAGNLLSEKYQQQINKIIEQYQPINAESQKVLKALKISSKQKALSEICLILDIILILSNSNFGQKKVQMKSNALRSVFTLLKFTSLPEEYKDKIQALQIHCFI